MSGYPNSQSQPSLAPPGQPVMRRSPPPKFRPCMIIIVVLSLGLVFIGLTLTIIAHWPGYTGIGYNPLKIVGPCMLAAGALVFIACIVEVVRKNQSEKENFNRQLQERERMLAFANRTVEQMSMGRSYTAVPQNPMADYRYGDGNYPPQQPTYGDGSYPPQNYGDGNYPPQGYEDPGNGYSQAASSHSASMGHHEYDDPDEMDSDEVFQHGGYKPVPKPRNPSRNNTLEMDYPHYDSVDASNSPVAMADSYYEQPITTGTLESGALAPEPVRPIKSKKKKPEEPETEAEKARRERKEKKKRQKEIQQGNSNV